VNYMSTTWMTCRLLVIMVVIKAERSEFLIKLIYNDVYLSGLEVCTDGIQGCLEDCCGSPPYQQRLRPWQQHWARGVASPGPQGIVTWRYLLGIIILLYTIYSSAAVININCETDILASPWHCNACMQTHGVDMYVNGHDHCLQRVSSRDR
jgi:hypothetical protein